MKRVLLSFFLMVTLLFIMGFKYGGNHTPTPTYTKPTYFHTTPIKTWPKTTAKSTMTTSIAVSTASSVTSATTSAATTEASTSSSSAEGSQLANTGTHGVVWMLLIVVVFLMVGILLTFRPNRNH